MKELRRLTYAQKYCMKRVSKLVSRFAMFSPNAKIGVAVSGGVDSWVMLKLLCLQKKKISFDIEFMVLHINPGFDPSNHIPLIDWVKKNGLPAHIEVGNMGVMAHGEANLKRSPCFYCTWRRRKRLFELVKKYRLTHLAFGHNADDMVDTFFMNLFYTGRVEGMFPKESFFKGEFFLIRPLLLVEKRWIKKAASEWKLPVWNNPCPSVARTKRRDTRVWLEEVCKENKKVIKNIYGAISRFMLNQQ